MLAAHFDRRKNRRSLAIFDRKDIAHPGASNKITTSGEKSKSWPEPQRFTSFWCTQGLGWVPECLAQIRCSEVSI